MSGSIGDNPYRASGVIAAAAGGGGVSWQDVTTGSTLTAEAGNGYPINTTSNACTVTLPASASVGDEIIFTDYLRTWGTNNLTISSSLNYQGSSSIDPVYDTNGESVHIVYMDVTQGWTPITDGAVANETSPDYSTGFVCIAGGASGTDANSAGGGGAGGYRSNYNSEATGGGGTEAALTLTRGTAYTITIGAGGAAPGSGLGNQGVDSTLGGSDITDRTSLGGGYGSLDNNTVANSGGCGGGGSDESGYYDGGAGTANQGYAGGDGARSGSGYNGGGGGGGAAVGVDAAGGVSGTGGAGGAGVASTIVDGSSVQRGGGGGGSSLGGTAGAGGAGGGGAGASGAGGTAVAGTANTGGGGGSTAGTAAAGGSGVVILRMADGNYSGTTTGSPTVTTGVSGDTVLIFTGSGSYTA